MDGNCDKNYARKFSELLGSTDKASWHYSIWHGNAQAGDNHKFWLFCYDKNGVHEKEHRGEIITNKRSWIKKFKGVKPELSELKKL